MGTRISYLLEVKQDVVKMKLEGNTTSEIMGKLGIKHKHRWILGGAGIEMVRNIGFFNPLENNTAMVRVLTS